MLTLGSFCALGVRVEGLNGESCPRAVDLNVFDGCWRVSSASNSVKDFNGAL